jgi:hypothetical protein
MGLWSKFDPDKTRALIHLMSERSGRYGMEADGVIRRLTNSQFGREAQKGDLLSVSRLPRNSGKFDPSETKSLTSKQ